MDLRHLAPKQPTALVVTVLLAVAACATAATIAWRGGWAPGRPAGLVAGAAAAAIVFLDGAYPLRRRLMRWPLTSAEHWLQFHVYAGGLACVLAVLHVGVRWPVGWLGWTMLATGAWSAASGTVGVFLQKRLPAVLAGLSVEASYERLPDLVDRLRARADHLMEGAPDAFGRVYQAEIRPALAGLQPSWRYLVDIDDTRRSRLSHLHDIEAFVGEAERSRLDGLAALVSEKLDLDVHGSLQRALRRWLVLHVPATALFTALLALHIAFVLSF